MEKKYILVFILLSKQACLFTENTQNISKKPHLKNNPHFIFEGGTTLSWWKNPSFIILDVSSNKDTAKGNRSKIVPGFYLLFARKIYPFDNPTLFGSLGIKCWYGRRKDALRNDFYDTDSSQCIS